MDLESLEELSRRVLGKIFLFYIVSHRQNLQKIRCLVETISKGVVDENAKGSLRNEDDDGYEDFI